jgi:hypothetical protein
MDNLCKRLEGMDPDVINCFVEVLKQVSELGLDIVVFTIYQVHTLISSPVRSPSQRVFSVPSSDDLAVSTAAAQEAQHVQVQEQRGGGLVQAAGRLRRHALQEVPTGTPSA